MRADLLCEKFLEHAADEPVAFRGEVRAVLRAVGRSPIQHDERNLSRAQVRHQLIVCALQGNEQFRAVARYEFVDRRDELLRRIGNEDLR